MIVDRHNLQQVYGLFELMFLRPLA